MNEVKMSWYEMKMRWKGQAGSWVQIMVERRCERDEILIFWKREVERSEIPESEVGAEVECWAEWRRYEGKLFHNMVQSERMIC